MAEETDLMGRYCNGDAAAFRALYAQIAPRMLNYLLRMSRDRSISCWRGRIVTLGG